MDHMILPSNAISTLPRIAFVSNGEYDRGDFFTYPTRIGWSLQEVQLLRTWRFEGLPGSKTAEEGQAFLQQWMFFGLLDVMFGKAVDWADFIDIHPSGRRYVHTRNLMRLIRRTLPYATSQENATEKAEYIYQCLLLTNLIHKKAAAAPNLPLNADFLLSLACLGHFADWFRSCLVQKQPVLSESTQFVIQHAPITIPTKPMLTWDSGSVRAPDGNFDAYKDETEIKYQRLSLLDNKLACAGWCPFQISRGITLSLSAEVFRAYLPRPNPRVKHDLCLRTECVACHIDEEEYRCVHVYNDCVCTFIEVQADGLQQALDYSNDSIPVVSVHSDDGSDVLSIRVKTAEPGEKFIAISHVWSHGLGNPKKNAMLQCQLVRLSRLVNALASGNNVPIWIDTLCCPVEPKRLRKLSISRMRYTYQNAAKVLVIDEWLGKLEFKTMNPLERCISIVTSDWCSRLWTWQEGAMPSELYIHFADGSVKLSKPMDFKQKFSAEVAKLLNFWMNHDDISQLFHLVRALDHSKTAGKRIRLDHLSHALEGRSTSVKADEVLCIGGMMGIDLAKIMEHPPQHWMRAFWSQIPEVPRDIIFWSRSRLSEPGLRWAPSTFLEGKQDAFLVTEYNATEQVMGRITGKGLRIQSPAILLGATDDFSIRNRCHILVTQPSAPTADRVPWLEGDVFSVPSSDGPPYICVAMLLNMELERRTTLSRKPFTMVYIYAEEGGVLYARRGDRGSLSEDHTINSPMARIASKRWDALYREGGRVEHSPDFLTVRVDGAYESVRGHMLPPDQEWCID